MAKKIKIFFLISVFMFAGCSAERILNSIYQLQFKIDSVSDFTLQDIPISNKRDLADFSSTELLKLITGFTKGDIPASFNVVILVKDPTATLFDLNIKIISFPWDLYVNNKKIISGNISQPISLSGKETTKKINIKVELNIFDLLTGSNIEELLQTVLQYGGGNATAENISIYVQPVIGTAIGNIKYPEKIKIVNYEFR